MKVLAPEIGISKKGILPEDWRKGGLQERRNEIIRNEQFYNQRYCGCEFSAGPDQAKND